MMMNIGKLLGGLSLLITSFSSPAFAQDEPKTPFKDRIFFGGNLGLQFGNLTYIDVSPLVGYKITDKLHAGIGATYIYYKHKDAYLKYETSIYGGRVFGRYYIMDNLFAHSEYEMLNLEVPETVTGGNYELVRDNISSVLVGGGYAQEIGANASLVLMLLWNLTEEQYSPYQNPIIRIGINAGF
jgi:hypothetical protein